MDSERGPVQSDDHIPVLFYLTAEWWTYIWEGSDFITPTEGTAVSAKQPKPSWLSENVPYRTEEAMREMLPKCHLPHKNYRITET